MPSTPPSIRLRRSLRLQLTRALGLLSVLVVAISATAIWGLARVSNAASQAINTDGHISGLASRLAIASLETHTMEHTFFGTVGGPENARVQAEQDWLTHYAELDTAIKAFAANATALEDQQAAARWRAAFVQSTAPACAAQ